MTPPGVGPQTSDLPAQLHAFWETVTRLGAAKLILPFLALMLVLLIWRGNLRGALIWSAAIAVAIACDFGWKVVYRATGFGVAALDFNAPSGHSLLSAAIYPVVFGWLFARGTRGGSRGADDDAGEAPKPRPGTEPGTLSPAAAAQAGAVRVSRRAAASFASLHEPEGLSGGGFGLGVALALLIAVSRLVLHFHSPAEAVAGFCLGYPASRIGRRAFVQVSQPPRALLLGGLVAMALFGAALLEDLPQLDLIRNVARGVSGRPETYERHHALVQMPPPPPSVLLSSVQSLTPASIPGLTAVRPAPGPAPASPKH